MSSWRCVLHLDAPWPVAALYQLFSSTSLGGISADTAVNVRSCLAARGSAIRGIGVKAQILVEPHTLRRRTLPRRPVQEGGWLAVEATSLSGIDAQAWAGEISQLTYPVILGRQIVGRIADSINGDLPYPIGSRVLVEPIIRCRRCSSCLAGLSFCSRRNPVNSYGLIPSTQHPGLWGGMAETLYIDPDARLHQISDDIPAVTATIAHALADGWTWAVHVPRLQAGENVLILGPGPRGLACLLAARSAGAGWVGISGLDVDSDRLQMARILGADLAVDVTANDLQDAVANSLGTRPDLVVDVTSNDPEAIYTALEIVRPGGQVILASTKGGRPISSLYSDVIVTKQLKVVGVLGPSKEGFRWGIQQLETDPRLDTLISHQFPLDESHLALAATSGKLGHEELISVAISC